MDNYDCTDDRKCVLRKCEYKSQYCDSSGKCPSGYKNYWGICLKEPTNRCKDHKDCPKYSGCNEDSGKCLLAACWNEGHCTPSQGSTKKIRKSKKKNKKATEILKSGFRLSLRTLNKCFRPNDIGLGFCYK